ncbi:MAG: hypothetical protein JWM74_6093, partial [Myxococcaceae bacterium]|nr:hypothetical protein [Myxococcaceae bacterium]
SRAEVFFRDSGASSLLNVFHFDVKQREHEATQDGWFAFFETLRAAVEVTAR